MTFEGKKSRYLENLGYRNMQKPQNSMFISSLPLQDIRPTF